MRRPSGSRSLAPALVALSLVAVGCGDDDSPPAAPTTTADGTATTTTSSGATTTVVPTGEVVRAYLLVDGRVTPVARRAQGDGVGFEALEGLLEGPTSEETALGLRSALPAGTEVLDLDITADVATVDLSPAFAQGATDEAVARGRLAQVVFTLTQFPTVNSVRFTVDGRELEALGPVALARPLSRADLEDTSAVILVESPLPFAEVARPVRLTGTANTFEATILVRVTAADGTVLHEGFTTATSGSGTRGTFDLELPSADWPDGALTVRLYEEDMSGSGRELFPVDVPLVLG